MLILPSSISSIKEKLDAHLGDTLTVVAQAGRKKVTKRKGTLTDTFPAVFVVDLDQSENNFERVSYSYTDLLTRNIELHFEGDDSVEVVAGEKSDEDDDFELDEDEEEFNEAAE